MALQKTLVILHKYYFYTLDSAHRIYFYITFPPQYQSASQITAINHKLSPTNYIPPISICFLIHGIISSNASAKDVLASNPRTRFAFSILGILF